MARVSGVAAAQDKCHPQTLAVTASRADGLGLKVKVGNAADFEFGSDVCGVLLQYPATDGSLHDYKARPWLQGFGSRAGNLFLACAARRA